MQGVFLEYFLSKWHLFNTFEVGVDLAPFFSASPSPHPLAFAPGAGHVGLVPSPQVRQEGFPEACSALGFLKHCKKEETVALPGC